MVVEMALCSCFHAVLCCGGGGCLYASGLASRAGLQVKSYKVMVIDRDEEKRLLQALPNVIPSRRVLQVRWWGRRV